MLLRGPQQRAVIGAGDADEHTHRLAPQPLRWHAAIFKGAPGHLQQHALLGIHAHRLPGRDAKESGIKVVDALHKATPAHVLREGVLRIGVVVLREAPTLRRHLGDRIAALPQQLPEIGWAVHATGKAAADPHDGNRLMANGCGLRGTHPAN